MTLDHVGIGVGDVPKSVAFYEKALAPLGILKLAGDGENYAGFGEGQKPYFWVAKPTGAPATDVHVAFVAESRALVDAFYEAAIAAGGSDNGKPGIRAEYHPNYYGAFVKDLDGNNIEAVCHQG